MLWSSIGTWFVGLLGSFCKIANCVSWITLVLLFKKWNLIVRRIKDRLI
jgi:hypothetical protein